MSLVSGDTGSKLEVPCIDDETDLAIDLSGFIGVKIKWHDIDGALVSKAMAVTDDVNGIAEYIFLADELFANQMKFEIELTDASNKVTRSVELIRENVRPALA